MIDERGQSWYHIKEPYGSYGDVFWGVAEAFRPLMAEDMALISPEIEDKRIDINLSRQTMSCYEGNREVHFCRISSGRDGADTPVGNNFYIFWELVSVHMGAGTAGAGYDLTGIGWPTFFAAGGIAIHSTFWHNNFGVRTSAGCVNARPADAMFVSRWAHPIFEYDPGVIDVGSTGVSTTLVRVLES
jgi:lipoprotein-anchoring transpeptidase ErfK/SrfK